MVVTDKGQVTIPKPLRAAAGIAPGTRVSFALEGGRIVVSPVSAFIRSNGPWPVVKSKPRVEPPATAKPSPTACKR